MRMQEDDDILEEITKIPIRVIAFDCGGVLLSNAWSDKEYKGFSKHYDLDHEKATEIFYKYWDDIELGKASSDKFFEALKKEFNICADIDEMKEVYRGIIRENEHVMRIARALSQKYDMYTLNNEGEDWMDDRIQYFSLKNIFKGFITSAYVGARKPDEKIYQIFLSKVEVEPEECVFIDDKEENLIPAHALGMKTVLFESPAKLIIDLRNMGLKFEVKQQ